MMCRPLFIDDHCQNPFGICFDTQHGLLGVRRDRRPNVTISCSDLLDTFDHYTSLGTYHGAVTLPKFWKTRETSQDEIKLEPSWTTMNDLWQEFPDILYSFTSEYLVGLLIEMLSTLPAKVKKHRVHSSCRTTGDLHCTRLCRW